MNYEKKYKDALNLAKSYYGKGTNEFLDTIFPELAESEDEKVIKIIKRQMCYDPDPVSDEERQLVETWLEKQKDHQNSSDAPNGSSEEGLISSPRKDKNLDEIAQDYVDNVRECNPEPTWDLVQTAVCYGYHYREQKEQKPAEWSEEDEKVRDSIIEYIDSGNIYATSKVNMISWLKYLHPQPKAEWSEEDKKQIRQIERIAQEAGCTKKLQEKIHSWLKSLRPSWKPTEEQMSSLLKAEGKMRELRFIAIASHLAELYEQLKKLM